MSFGKVQEGFWTDEKILGLNEDGKLLALYILTGPHRNMIGCFRLPVEYVMGDLKWDRDRVSDTLSELVSIGFITRCETTGWVLVNNLLKYDPIVSPKTGVAAARLAAAVPRKSAVWQGLMQRLIPYGTKLPQGFFREAEYPSAYPIGNGMPSPEPEPEPEQEPIPPIPPVPGGGGPDRFEEFWTAYPSRGEATNPKKPAREKFARLVKAGADPDEIIRGVKGYGAHCGQSGKAGTDKVKQAITFLNQEVWKQYANVEPMPDRAERFGEPTQRDREIVERLRAKYVTGHHAASN